MMLSPSRLLLFFLDNFYLDFCWRACLCHLSWCFNWLFYHWLWCFLLRNFDWLFWLGRFLEDNISCTVSLFGMSRVSYRSLFHWLYFDGLCFCDLGFCM